ncbi:unnamed protein product [Paramecium sonneborni]|uniref:Uncharacterized protein n=1 Tax=Paramecium sonneborni TaxID=65129 RepID=A0A8S1QWQ5_9CILI|nr:unnamed protein product [Paramecium sonneborni]
MTVKLLGLSDYPFLLSMKQQGIVQVEAFQCKSNDQLLQF